MSLMDGNDNDYYYFIRGLRLNNSVVGRLMIMVMVFVSVGLNDNGKLQWCAMAIMVIASFNWHNVFFHNFGIQKDKQKHRHTETRRLAKFSRCSRTRCNVVPKHYLFQCLRKKRELQISNNIKKMVTWRGKAHNYGCRIEANNEKKKKTKLICLGE